MINIFIKKKYRYLNNYDVILLRDWIWFLVIPEWLYPDVGYKI